MLYGECIRVCPKGAPVLNVRIRGAELWNARTADRTAAVFRIVLVGTQIFQMAGLLGLLRGRDGTNAAWWVSALAMMGPIAAAFLIAHFIAPTIFPKGTSHDQPLIRSMYALLPIAAATEMAYHLERLLMPEEELVATIGRQIGIDISLPALIAVPSTVYRYQNFNVLAGTVASSLLA